MAIKYACMVGLSEPTIPLLDNLCIGDQSVKCNKDPRTGNSGQVFAESTHNASHRVHVIKDCVDEAVKVNTKCIGLKRGVMLLNLTILA